MDPSLKRNYSYSYKDHDLCFETGYFGFKVNSSDLTTVKFGLFNDRNNDLSYLEALSRDSGDRMQTQLNEEDLVIEISHLMDGGMGSDWEIDSTDYVTHKIVSSDTVRLWESGRIAQHYDFKQLTFKQTHGEDTDRNKNIDNWDVTLFIMVWPQSITFTVELVKKKDSRKDFGSLYKSLFVKVKMKGWQRTKIFDNYSTQRNCHLSLLCDFNRLRDTMMKNINIDCCYTRPRQQLSAKVSERFGCYLLTKDASIDRAFKGGYTDIRDYDDFRIFIQNQSDVDLYVPILLFVQRLANPTGLCPIVCDAEYEPTAIHIQLSKNWHNIVEMPSYGRFFTFLPAKAKSRHEYHVRIPYGFYGTIPTASHSNLSLIEGSHGSLGGRWEQLSIGCFGETYCMDTDMGCTKQIITDIRTLYIKGKDGNLWHWSDAGWGGDWLKVSDTNKNRLMPFAWKTAYEAHGPCLTGMHVDGWYKNEAGDQTGVSATVRTLRTDDYARTFTSLKYIFTNGDLPACGSYFFALGGSSTPYVETPFVACGCKDGLTEELDFTSSEVEPEEYVIERKELSGSPPWFIGFPGQEIHYEREWGKGFRAIIIRNFEASFNKVEYKTPSISLIGSLKRPAIKSNVRVEIVPPVGVNSYYEGDSVSLDVCLITLPKKESAYYGTNEDFKNHLRSHPDSWENVYREAIGNNLKVTVAGGMLKSSYPIIIKALSQETINVSIEGGVGMLPVKFEGLQSKNMVLKYQAESGKYEKFTQDVHGSDYWQTDFDAKALVYSLTFNIPTNEAKPLSLWKLEMDDH